MARIPNAQISETTSLTTTEIKDNIIGFANQHLVDFGIIAVTIMIGIILGKKMTKWIFGN